MDVNKKIMAEYFTLLDNAKRICKDPDTSQEILQMCLLSFCELAETRQQQIINSGKLENFITKCVSLNYNSKTSPYHRLYRKYDYSTTPLWEDWDYEDGDQEWRDIWHSKCECVEKAYNDLHWYSRALLDKKFKEEWTYQQLHQYYNISLNSLVKDIKSALLTLKQQCQ